MSMGEMSSVRAKVKYNTFSTFHHTPAMNHSYFCISKDAITRGVRIEHSISGVPILATVVKAVKAN